MSNRAWFVTGGLHNRKLLDERFLGNGSNLFCGEAAETKGTKHREGSSGKERKRTERRKTL